MGPITDQNELEEGIDVAAVMVSREILEAFCLKSEEREIIAKWCESEAAKADKTSVTVTRCLAREWHRWRAGWLRMQAAELRADHD